MTATTAPRGWLLDLDGTLYRALFVKCAMAGELSMLGWSALETLRRFRKVHEQLRDEIRRNPVLEFAPNPLEEQLTRTADSLGVPLEEVRAVVNEWMIERPCKWLALCKRSGLLKEIRDFRAAGGRTALVSDYPAARKLAALGASELFDVVVSNGEHPRLTRIKPSADGYRLAASELELEPEHCLVIGDRQDADGLAARSAGMRFRLI